MLKLEFHANTPEELAAHVRDFVKGLKGTRAGKGGDDNEDGAKAPPPQAPPTGQTFQAQGGGAAFAPQAGGVVQTGAAFVAPGAPSPEVLQLVQGIVTRLDGAIQSGQAPDAALNWAKQQIAPHDASVANATMDQVKQHYLPRLPLPALQQVARFMGMQV